MGAAPAILALVAAQRLAELVVARRNARRLLAAGGCEIGARHYPLFVLLHVSWLVALALRTGSDTEILWSLIAAFVALQAGRVWVIASLGRYWTTRIVTLPAAPLVRRGPYRYLRHPNYLIVAAEIPILPLAFGEWPVAIAFGTANLALLWWRIRVEEAALAGRRPLRGASHP